MSVARVHDLRAAVHGHRFADAGRAGRQRALGAVTILTLATMVVELVAGWWTGSLALTADGWHMGTHALAIGGAWLAARWAAHVEAHGDAHGEALAQRPGEAVRYTFGGWKIEVLAAYTSGLALGVVAAWLAVDGVRRLLAPEPVAFVPALVVAVIGLVVNVASALLLLHGGRDGHASAAAHGHHHAHHGSHHPAHDHADDHADDHAQGQDHGHAHVYAQGGHAHDHNFNAAYLHVVADALTSVLAIGALAGGAAFGWLWLDAAVALAAAAVILRWSLGVLAGSARALVDATADPALVARVREALQSDGDATVADLHVWQVGSRAWSVAAAVVADEPLPSAAYRERLAGIEVLRHVTVEVHRCPGCDVAGATSAASSVPASTQAASTTMPSPGGH